MKRKTYFNAYFTVEAALILPLALGLVIFLIYLMFFQYDRCLIEQDIGILSMRSNDPLGMDNRGALDRIEKQAAEVYWKKYAALQHDRVEIVLKNGKVNVSGGGIVQVPFSKLQDSGNLGAWQVKAEYETRRMNPALFIRTCRRLKHQAAEKK